MKICLVHEEYPEETNFGGISTYQKTCAEEYVKQGHEVYVIARGLKKSYDYVENGVNITRIFVKQTDDQIANYTKYREIVKDKLLELQSANKIDIIEVPDWGAETVLFEEFRKVPLVVRLHTPLKVWLKYNKNNFGEVTDLMLEWEEKMLKQANLITCCSNALKNLIVKGFKINKNRIKVTPNPANLANFYPDKSVKKENAILYVGSTEERKGVCVLAEALNYVFEKHKDLKVRFIGKDTNRNKLNISTVEYIKQIVNEKYRDNLEFLGQLSNDKINPYVNASKCMVFPSLFDNFPYVVLEAMATGTPIVGSSNSGMVEMLEDKTSIYKTGNAKNLAKVILNTLKNKTFEQRNIDRVNYLYNPSQVCENMLQMYSIVIKEYHSKKDTNYSFETLINSVVPVTVKVLGFEQEKRGVANKVYKVFTDDKTYIVKKYMYDYDFSLSNKLYDCYEENGINVVRPINKDPIKSNHCEYNIFEYVEKVEGKKPSAHYLTKLVLTNRKDAEGEIEILNKCQRYASGIANLHNDESFLNKDSRFVQSVFESIKKDKIFKEKYLNHGDISSTNIIVSKAKNYLIDFDETLIAPRLYDFAVVTVKNFTKNGRLKQKEFSAFFNKIQENLKYENEDYLTVIKFYLCKILLEKFYLHYTNKINLLSSVQKRDYYKQYVKLLKYFNKLEVLK